METRIDRRKFLKLGVTVAGVAVSQTTLSCCVRGFGGDGRDHATAAQGAYRRSLTALRRSAVTPGGTERTETGLDRLAPAPRGVTSPSRFASRAPGLRRAHHRLRLRWGRMCRPAVGVPTSRRQDRPGR